MQQNNLVVASELSKILIAKKSVPFSGNKFGTLSKLIVL